VETWCNFFRQISAVSLAFFILAMLGIGMAVSDSLLEQSPVIRVTQALAGWTASLRSWIQFVSN